MKTDTTSTDLPGEARGWNWGAFLLTWIWGLGNRTPIALLALIPLVNFVMMFVLGARGNEWAWKNDTWKGVDHFRRTQRNWTIAGVIVWVAVIVLVGGTFWGVQSLMKGNGAYQLSLERLRTSAAVTERLGEPLQDGWFPTGSVSMSGGAGEADLAISISGPRGSATAYSRAVREAEIWRLTYLAVRIDGSEELIRIVPE